MSILIKGMEMPKRGHTVTITIVGSGETYVEYYDCKPHVEETIEYKAIPVPEHGRLIDADALSEEHRKRAYATNGGSYQFHITARAWVDDAPTIIPADLPVMYYPQVDGITPTIIPADKEGE